MYSSQRFYAPVKLQNTAFNTYNYIVTTEIVIICSNISHFQLLLLFVGISFHDGRKEFPEVDVVEWLCASLTDDVSISKSCVNLLTNHLVVSE
jgi:hypothetical protein